MNKLNFGKNKTSAILAMLALLLIALGCGAEKPSAPPTEAEAQALVKNTMSEFADAVEKVDFTAFKANTSKEFQSQYTEDQMKSTFKTLTDQKATAAPILREASKMNPKFTTTPPAVREEQGYSILVADGTFDTDPELKFSNEYVYQGGKWKLLKISFK